jgi:aspartate/methionine/tyrosine aminotransferase
VIPDSWIAERTKSIELSGIRKVFELGKSLKDPVNLSIGQPDFEVPEPIRDAAKRAIDSNHNGYTVTQGIPDLRAKLLADVQRRLGNQSGRDLLVTSGTSGGLLLALLATVNPGDEVITPDPYFVAYPHMITLAGGRMAPVETYPDFKLDPDRIRAAITPRTKAILLSTPSNPTGAVADAESLLAIAKLARERGILLMSDEIYRAFNYDGPPISPSQFDDSVLVLDGFGKTYGITGWRLGFAHGPSRVIAEMAKLQQFTYVCAPSPAQHGAIAALDFDISHIIANYKRKRDRMIAGLSGAYELPPPGGAFYLFPKAPWGTATEFVSEAIRNNLLIIPGSTFSGRDTHFRLSYAASDEMLERGIAILRQLAERNS